MLKTDDRKRSKLQERKAAAKYSGTTNSGSGNGWVRKADVRTEAELFELKTTNKFSYPLDCRELQKLWDQAILDDRIPVFEIEFADRGVTCVILDKNDYIVMRERLCQS